MNEKEFGNLVRKLYYVHDDLASLLEDLHDYVKLVFRGEKRSKLLEKFYAFCEVLTE